MIFLSASIPVQERDQKYIDTADLIAIRDSIRALSTVVIPNSHLVWGGHPAITPLIHYVLERMRVDYKKHLTLYQSKEYEQYFPENNDFFDNVVVTRKGIDKQDSLEIMRNKMISSHPFTAGIFIGGMEGVEKEFDTFRRYHPEAQLLPVASTGAAARLLYDNLKTKKNERLLNDYAYMAMFKVLLRDQLNGYSQ